MIERKVLVVGATGQQGGALINGMLNSKAKFRIYGLTSNGKSPSATRLLSLGVRIVEGDVTVPLPIFEKLGKDVWGVFSVTNPGSNEEQDGIPLIDAAVAAVLSSSLYAPLFGSIL